MFRWLINKEIRTDLDILYSKIARLQADMDAIRTNMGSLRNFVWKSKPKTKSSEVERDAEDEALSPADIPAEAREFYEKTIEFQQAQKFKKLNELED